MEPLPVVTDAPLQAPMPAWSYRILNPTLKFLLRADPVHQAVPPAAAGEPRPPPGPDRAARRRPRRGLQTDPAPQPPPAEAILAALLNDLAALSDRIVLVLDDYHALDSSAVDQALTFLIDHLPPQLHLVLVTREDSRLPLARLRARDQLTELRAADLRFTPAEAAAFLTQVMGLSLSADAIAALEARTEGWVAGLQWGLS